MEGLKKFVNSIEMEGSYSSSQSKQGSQNSNSSSAGSETSVCMLNRSLFSQAAMSQRIVNVEYYMSFPIKEFDNLHSEFRNSAVKKVPVIRIFGTTPAGQKMCANVHGVYPYISILDDETVEGFEYRIAAALDNAINDTVTTTNKFGKGGQSYKNSATQHVFKVVRVIGKTFYGFRASSEVFIRIFFYNPLMSRKAIDLLQSGSVLGRRFQPYEAHIPYSLQFMIDYCLYGMNYIHYSAVKFRRNSKDITTKFSEDISSLSQNSNSSLPGYIDPNCIQESLLGPTQLTKLTLCELEVDVLASDIILGTKTSERAMSVNPGIDAIWKDEIERRRLHGVENCSQITIPESQERSQAPPMHPTEKKYMQILLGKLQSFFDKNDESNTETSFFNHSSIDDAERIPSSQVLDHLSDEGPPKDDQVVNSHLSQEEDEFIKLLEKMAEEPVNESKGNEIMENPFGIAIGGNQEMNDSADGDANGEEDLWNDSLLSCSILEKISDTEITYQDPEPREDSNISDPSSRIIFQCDGQGGGESDSNSDDNATVKNLKSPNKTVSTRLSRRMSDVKFKSKELSTAEKGAYAKNETKRKPGRPSMKNHQSSPVVANRLSLTLRRKSRSQDTVSVKTKSQNNDKMTSDRIQEKTKLAHRRSRSMSLGSKDKERSLVEKAKQISTNPKKTKKAVGVGKTSVDVSTRPTTRKSSSVPSAVNRIEKGKEKPDSRDTASIAKPTTSYISNITTGEVKNKAGANTKLVTSKIFKKQPFIFLEKIDVKGTNPCEIVPESKLSSKRVRRRPRRFTEDQDEGSTPSTANVECEAKDDLQSKEHREPIYKEASDSPEKMEIELSQANLHKHKEKEENVVDEVDIHNKVEPATVTSVGIQKPKNRRGRPPKIKRKLKVEVTKESSDTKQIRDDGDNLKRVTDVSPKVAAKPEASLEVLDKKGLNGVKKLEIVKRQKKNVGPTNSESTTGDIDSTPVNSSSRNDIKAVEESDDVSKNEIIECPNEAPKSEDSVNSGTGQINDESKQIGQLRNDSKDNDDKCEPLQNEEGNECNTFLKKKKRLGLVLSKSNQVKIAPQTTHASTARSETGESKKVNDVSEDAKLVKDNSSDEGTVSLSQTKMDMNEGKQFSDVGITCKPDNESVMSQTDTKPFTKDATVAARPITKENGSQSDSSVATSETQTDKKEMVTAETQTDAIVPLCLCQCTCVLKDKIDASIGNQDELKPTTENKRIQVDNTDIILKARSSRFTTPQGNKIRRTSMTPSKSPEKRKTNHDSPSRRQMMNKTTPTPSNSRYLSALILKTPTSHHKYRGYGKASPLNDSVSYQDGEQQNIATPPSRESREGYLINSIRAASSSPKKRLGSFRPRNLDVESKNEVNSVAAAPTNSPAPEFDVGSGSIEDEIHEAMETGGECEDLSVNSIYEYEEEPSTSSPQISTPASVESEEYSPASLSSFQKKRILSKHRTKNRQEKKKAAIMDANRGIPDIFDVEYEPLKPAPSYKSTIKWLDAELHRTSIPNTSSRKTGKNSMLPEESSSDEDSLPPPVKLFGGGNMSDDEDSDDDRHPSSGSSSTEIRKSVKPFTPPLLNFSMLTPSVNESSQNTNDSVCNSATPRSILRQNSSSRRHNARVSKRKIRWEDDEPCKRIKIEDSIIAIKKEDDDASQSSLLANGTLNRTVDTSELDGPTFKNVLGLDNSMSNFQDVKALHQCQFLTTMCVELHCSSRNELLPDPAVDPILAIFVLISNDYPDHFRKPKECKYLLVLDENAETMTTTDSEFSEIRNIRSFSSEGNLIDGFVGLVRMWDPDIFVGYEIEKASFGYLLQRGLCFGKDLTQELSRVLPIVRKDGTKESAFRGKEEWNGTIVGRIVLNLWRLLRHELPVQSYTFENAAYLILHRRVCKFSQKSLSAYWSHKMHRHKVIQYYTIRTEGVMQIMDKLDLINRTSELARLFGIQFYEVLSRGSQFRVESMMLRATKPLDMIAPSPNPMQRAKMRAPEYLPLILEPRSNYYTDPVAVLDFQSLYPSMMIAYNYDYASLLGRVEHLGQMERFPLGCLENAVSPADLLRLKDHIHISPAGVAFLDKSVVKGVVPEMLEQILDTRQMVKRAMKKWKKEGASLQKVLDSRQLGLKLIANVTYGYTSANFSGRMPCVEIADSIVSKGRETLQRAIDHVKENYDRWGAEVVYGDTDSLFILFKGRSRDEAFKLAYEIAEEVTQANPKPVKLKFEKIYQPCILQSKKRYVGYAYETPDQVKPNYDAKGIETVRRDGCPAVKKILEKTLHILFSSNSCGKVENYVKSQFEKLFKGRVSMQDYIFAREYRGRQGYQPTARVPSLDIAKKLVESDPRAEPLVSERVPYVVIYGNPTLPLIKLVRTPDEYLKNPAMRLNAHYYIEKAIIPALNRCLKLAKMDALKWYVQLPRKYLRNVLDQKSKGQGTLDDYVLHQNCLRCDGKAEQGLCNNCLNNETESVIYLQEVLRNAKSKLNACIEICTNCAGETDRCVNVDCQTLHKLTRYQRDQAYMKNVERELVKLDW